MAKRVSSFILLIVFQLLTFSEFAFATDPNDIFEKEGIHYPTPPHSAAQETSSEPATLLSPEQVAQINKLPHGQMENASYGYVVLYLLITAFMIALALAKVLWRTARRKLPAKQTHAPDEKVACQARQTAYQVNKHQRLVLIATAIVMALMIAFPPFHIVSGGHEVMALGYHFGAQFSNGSVDRQLLYIQLVVTLLIGAIGALIFQTRKPNDVS